MVDSESVIEYDRVKNNIKPDRYAIAHRHASISKYGTIAGSSSDALLL